MQRNLLALGVVCFLCFVPGCLESPSSPVSSIPMILVDHIQETEETKVYVQGLDDHRFSNITIQINGLNVTENLTYALHLSTSLTEFALNVTVWDEIKEYEYRGNLSILREDDQVTLQIEDQKHDDIIERSLPYTTIMERKE